MNILYLCPVSDRPIGGVKVVYNHSEILVRSGISSQILHSKTPKASKWFFFRKSFFRPITYSCGWFDHDACIRSPKQKIDPQKDFVVIPEIWAAPYGDYLYRSGIRYAIFVQGGYLLQKGQRHLTEADLKAAYTNAQLILTISEDTSHVVSLKYPFLDSAKIMRLFPGIDASLFSSGVKEKLITYMPRRLPEHSKKMLFFLEGSLPAGWKILPIANMSEQEVANLLSRSAIFMSFCDQEGCPLPPLEAAFSANLVVGYTGQGANEYFQTPLFRKVENGNFIEYTTAVLQAIADVEGGMLSATPVLNQVEEVKKIYSLDSARERVLEFGRRVQVLQ